MLAFIVALCVSQLPVETGSKPVHGWAEAADVFAESIMQASHVEVFRLGEPPSRGSGFRGDLDLFGRSGLHGGEKAEARQPLSVTDYPVLAANPAPAWALRERLLFVLRTGRFPAYTWKTSDGRVMISQKACGPLRPSVAFRFHTPAGLIELMVCFECRQAQLSSQGLEVMLHLDALWPPLLALALESFPFDRGLNALTRERD